MICRNCGTEIADKAIVCYRCGTGTAEPVRKPANVRRRRSPVAPAVVILVVLALLAWYLGRSYHVFGVEWYAVDSTYSWAHLIDFSPTHA
jgi:hypothetical protein